jgi:type IV pilus assembly protein PilE
MKIKKLKGFTLTELLIVLAVIGVLVLLALPMLSDVGIEAAMQEANLNLKTIKDKQTAYRTGKFKYGESIEDIKFTPPKLEEDGGTARFTYSIVSAGKTTFLAKAKAVEDFDGDGQLAEITINQDGRIETLVED